MRDTGEGGDGVRSEGSGNRRRDREGHEGEGTQKGRQRRGKRARQRARDAGRQGG